MRTLIMVGLLAGSAVAVRRAWGDDRSADEVPRPVPSARHRDAAPRPEISRDLVVRVDRPATPKVAADTFAALADALLTADVLDDGPSLEPDDQGDWLVTPTVGSVSGKVRDVVRGDEVAGVTVIATSPALTGTQCAITDEHGDYRISGLPPGEYLITFYYMDTTIERSGQTLVAGSTRRLPLVLDPDEHDTPTIDPTSTVQGITIDKNYVVNIPIPTRVFESVIGAAAGEQREGAYSFSGSASLENSYDGEFLEEVEIIDGHSWEYTRTAEVALGAAVANRDGVTFSSGTTLENTYYVDGVPLPD